MEISRLFIPLHHVLSLSNEPLLWLPGSHSCQGARWHACPRGTGTWCHSGPCPPPAQDPGPEGSEDASQRCLPDHPPPGSHVSCHPAPLRRPHSLPSRVWGPRLLPSLMDRPVPGPHPGSAGRVTGLLRDGAPQGRERTVFLSAWQQVAAGPAASCDLLEHPDSSSPWGPL